MSAPGIVIGGNVEESPAARFERWFADGDTTACVFENKDLGHRDIGRRIVLPYTKEAAAGMAIGTSRAPDMAAIGLGWRYVLVARCTTPAEALAALGNESA